MAADVGLNNFRIYGFTCGPTEACKSARTQHSERADCESVAELLVVALCDLAD